MKKLFSILLIMVMLLPITVKADRYYSTSYHNRNVVVGGEVEVSTTIPTTNSTYKVVYSFDPDKIEVKKGKISTNFGDEVSMPDPETGELVKAKAIKDITIEEGKVTIEINAYPAIAIESYSPDALNVRFNSIEEGTSEIGISFVGADAAEAVPSKLSINARYADCSTTEEKPDEQEPTEEEPKEEEKDKEENKETANEETKKTYTDLFLYISLGFNAFLIFILIKVLMSKKKSLNN